MPTSPGNKDGWEDNDDVWITNTVGFAGPHERYTLAIMYDLSGGETFHQGSNTLTQISSLLFRGHRAPQPVAEATPLRLLAREATPGGPTAL